MIPVLVIVGACCIGVAGVWVIPVVALSGAVALVAPEVGITGGLIVGALALAVPAAAGLAGALLDRVCRGETPQALFRPFFVVLAGAIVVTTVDLPAFLGAAIAVERAVEPVSAFGVLAEIVGAVCRAGGLAALVALGWLALIEVPLRWLCGVARSGAFDLSLGALRPFALILIVGLLVPLVSGLWGHELSPGGGQP